MSPGKGIKSISILHLHCDDAFVNTKNYKELIRNGKSPPSLSRLILKFEYCKGVIYSHLRTLSPLFLRNLTSLTSLNLKFRYCGSNKWFKTLGLAIKRLTSLTNLRLELYYHITDNGTTFESLLENVGQLKSLSINICVQNEIAQHPQRILSSCRTPLASLSNLHLRLERSSRPTDNYFRDFALDLRHLVSLSCLKLFFFGCDCAYDKGLEDLGSLSLKYLASLTILDLTFKDCYRFTLRSFQSCFLLAVSLKSR